MTFFKQLVEASILGRFCYVRLLVLCIDGAGMFFHLCHPFTRA